MTEETENIIKKNQPGALKKLLGGSILASGKVMEQLPFLFFLVLLGMILITNRNWSEKTLLRTEEVKESLKELRAESVTHETRLMSINRPSEVTKRVQEREIGLIEPKEPAMKIKISKADQ